MKSLASIIWPAFVMAAVADLLFFTLIDPKELYFVGDPVELGTLATYSIGFLLFGALAAASSAFTAFLMRTSEAMSMSSFSRSGDG